MKPCIRAWSVSLTEQMNGFRQLIFQLELSTCLLHHSEVGQRPFFSLFAFARIFYYFFLLHFIINWRWTHSAHGDECKFGWNSFGLNCRREFHRIQISISWQVFLSIYFHTSLRAAPSEASNKRKYSLSFYNLPAWCDVILGLSVCTVQCAPCEHETGKDRT